MRAGPVTGMPGAEPLWALHGESGAAGREANAAVGRLNHVMGHLHNIGAPIELLRLVFEKIGAGEGVAIGFDKTAARVSRNRRIAPAEFLARMLGVEAPAFETYGKGVGVERI